MPEASHYSVRVVEAFAMMHELHRDQRRKGGDIPYITHLMAVAALVGEHGGDEDCFIAALLHDAVEDQGGEAVLLRIREAFGDKVAALVLGASDTMEVPKPPWRARKEKHIAHMREADADLRMLLCADKIHNARAIIGDLRNCPPDYWRRFNGGKEGTLWYYRTACDALGHGWEHPLLDLLQREVEGLEEAVG